MPVKSYQIPGGMTVRDKVTGQREFKPAARVLIFTCEVCGEPASHGIGVDIRAAMKTGRVELAGKWYCNDHLGSAANG